MTQSPVLYVCSGGLTASFINTWRLNTGGKTQENRFHTDMVLYAGRLDSCTSSQGDDRRTAL